MSPDMRTTTAKFQALHEHSDQVVINGPHPSSLSINKYSHFIRKSSSSVIAMTKTHKQNTNNNPIIIYTQSSKIIHTKPRDFMALVQRLTGMTQSNEHVIDTTSSENFGSFLCDGSKSISNMEQQEKKEQSEVSWSGDKISPDLRDGERCVKQEQFVEHGFYNLGSSDVPLFTPNSVYKYADSPFGFLGTLLSPSGLEFSKELPEY